MYKALLVGLTPLLILANVIEVVAEVSNQANGNSGAVANPAHLTPEQAKIIDAAVDKELAGATTQSPPPIATPVIQNTPSPDAQDGSLTQPQQLIAQAKDSGAVATTAPVPIASPVTPVSNAELSAATVSAIPPVPVVEAPVVTPIAAPAAPTAAPAPAAPATAPAVPLVPNLDQSATEAIGARFAKEATENANRSLEERIARLEILAAKENKENQALSAAADMSKGAEADADIKAKRSAVLDELKNSPVMKSFKRRADKGSVSNEEDQALSAAADMFKEAEAEAADKQAAIDKANRIGKSATYEDREGDFFRIKSDIGDKNKAGDLISSHPLALATGMEERIIPQEERKATLDTEAKARRRAFNKLTAPAREDQALSDAADMFKEAEAEAADKQAAIDKANRIGKSATYEDREGDFFRIKSDIKSAAGDLISSNPFALVTGMQERIIPQEEKEAILSTEAKARKRAFNKLTAPAREDQALSDAADMFKEAEAEADATADIKAKHNAVLDELKDSPRFKAARENADKYTVSSAEDQAPLDAIETDAGDKQIAATKAKARGNLKGKAKTYEDLGISPRTKADIRSAAGDLITSRLPASSDEETEARKRAFNKLTAPAREDQALSVAADMFKEAEAEADATADIKAKHNAVLDELKNSPRFKAARENADKYTVSSAEDQALSDAADMFKEAEIEAEVADKQIADAKKKHSAVLDELKNSPKFKALRENADKYTVSNEDQAPLDTVEADAKKKHSAVLDELKNSPKFKAARKNADKYTVSSAEDQAPLDTVEADARNKHSAVLDELKNSPRFKAARENADKYTVSSNTLMNQTVKVLSDVKVALGDVSAVLQDMGNILQHQQHNKNPHERGHIFNAPSSESKSSPFGGVISSTGGTSESRSSPSGGMISSAGGTSDGKSSPSGDIISSTGGIGKNADVPASVENYIKSDDYIKKTDVLVKKLESTQKHIRDVIKNFQPMGLGG
jgi:hypothetical protein